MEPLKSVPPQSVPQQSVPIQWVSLTKRLLYKASPATKRPLLQSVPSYFFLFRGRFVEGTDCSGTLCGGRIVEGTDFGGDAMWRDAL